MITVSKNPIARAIGVAVVLSIGTLGASAQTFTNLYSFSRGGPEGQNPADGLILYNGTLYGTANTGGSLLSGTVFAAALDGSGITPIHSFATRYGTNSANVNGALNLDGANPAGALLALGTNLFGTAEAGGTNGFGTLYSVNTNGDNFSAIHTFASIPSGSSATNSDGATPVGSLVAFGDTLYGTASAGGGSGVGTVFKVDLGGANYTVLHSFTNASGTNSGTNFDGADPQGGLTIASGILYGTAFKGGTNDNGLLFKLNRDGTGYTNFLVFTGTNGAGPFGTLAISGTNIYGVTSGGDGTNGNGTIYSVNTDGSGFQTLHTFSSATNQINADGVNPGGGLIVSNGILYGVAFSGGTGGAGTVFSLSTNGSNFTVLHSFTALGGTSLTNNDGANPVGALVLTNNELYGVTLNGGTAGFGAIYQVALHPKFFAGEIATSNGVYYLTFPNSNYFGFYNYTYFPYLYHYNLGFEYFIDANDGASGAYLYDFTSGHFFYTNPSLFPYLYDFSLTAFLYYYPDPNNGGQYTTNPRSFYNFGTGQVITQ